MAIRIRLLTRGLGVFFTLLLLMVAPAAVAAQTGTVSGTVQDEGGSAVSGAQVILQGTGLQALTGSAGTFQITGVARAPISFGWSSSDSGRPGKRGSRSGPAKRPGWM